MQTAFNPTQGAEQAAAPIVGENTQVAAPVSAPPIDTTQGATPVVDVQQEARTPLRTMGVEDQTPVVTPPAASGNTVEVLKPFKLFNKVVEEMDKLVFSKNPENLDKTREIKNAISKLLSGQSNQYPWSPGPSCHLYFGKIPGYSDAEVAAYNKNKSEVKTSESFTADQADGTIDAGGVESGNRSADTRGTEAAGEAGEGTRSVDERMGTGADQERQESGGSEEYYQQIPVRLQMTSQSC